MTPTAALLLALAVPAAPAPKVDKGLPRDLIDLIPEDATGVLVIDVPRVARSDIGQAILKEIAAGQTPDDPFRFADLVKDAELVVVAQFLIDKGFGDFCLLVRHKPGARLPKDLVARAEKAGKDKAPEQIGKRTVYSIQNAELSFALADDRTVMLVLATGDQKQVQQTRAAAYGEREKPGPSHALRKLIAAGDTDDRALRLYGSHPKKLGLSTWLVLAAFGVKDERFAHFEDKVVSYRGGIKAGDAGEIELRFTARDADAAKELLKAYEEGGEEKDPFVRELRAAAKAVRDGDEVVVTGKLTRAMVERLGKRPNK
jgi:hypothetical protein